MIRISFAIPLLHLSIGFSNGSCLLLWMIVLGVDMTHMMFFDILIVFLGH